jgi:hypothetical protein
MVTAATLIADVRRLYGDPDGEFITDAVGMEWANLGQERFCNFVMPLDEVQDITLTARQKRYDLNSDCQVPTRVIWYKDLQEILTAESPAEFERIQSGWPNGVGRPTYYTVFRRQIVVGPQSPAANSATSVASGAQTGTSTTIGVATSSGVFRTSGWAKVASTGEVFEYTGIGSGTLTGCTRAVHNTTATAFSSGATITQIDLQVQYRKIPSGVSTTTESPSIPAAFHRYLEMYMLYRAWLARGDSDKAQIAYNEFEALENNAKEISGRRFMEPISIKDRRTQRNWW